MALLTCFLLVIIIPYAASISFNFTYIGPEKSKNEIISRGGASISDDGIQVTPELDRSDPNKLAGQATYVKLLHLWDKNSTELASFSTSFVFVIDSFQNESYGDGLTFFLAHESSVIYGGGAMGLPFKVDANVSASPFVAVEFDTFCNLWDPVSQFDCIGDHVGIDINSVTSVISMGWSSNITYGKECQAWIEYDSDSKNLSVSFTSFEDNIVVVKTGLDHIIDLREVLPEWVNFGFSAATGQLFEKNNVKSWNFSSSELKVDEVKALPPATSPPMMSTPTTSHKGIMGGLIAAGLFVVLFIFAFFLWKNKNKGERAEEPASGVKMNKDFEMGTGPRRFSYQELFVATAGFVETKKLGQGGFGGVYKGFLKDLGTFIAVKRVSKTSEQGIKEYASEVKIISQLRHRNLVLLNGWCHDQGELLLVYEFMENGSLDLHLFKGKSFLTWARRYKIARGLASALLYLHEEWEQCVLHRDIKSSNVMLDSSFNAKLGDFGLAKLVDHEKGYQTTILAGTLGYMAPECIVTGKASKESDVFSFGVVALEIACGRKPTNPDAQEINTKLQEWVWNLYSNGTLLDAVDPNLRSDFSKEEVERLMIVGLWCVHPDSGQRPSMRQVIQVLNIEASVPILPSKMPNVSYGDPPNSLYGGTSGGSYNTVSSNLTSSTTSSLSPSVSRLYLT